MELRGYYSYGNYVGLTPYGWMRFPTEGEYREFMEEYTGKKGNAYDRNISTSNRGNL